jgi:hypothetical protein
LDVEREKCTAMVLKKRRECGPRSPLEYTGHWEDYPPQGISDAQRASSVSGKTGNCSPRGSDTCYNGVCGAIISYHVFHITKNKLIYKKNVCFYGYDIEYFSAFFQFGFIMRQVFFI